MRGTARSYSRLCAQGLLLVRFGDHVEFWELDLGWPCARPMPYLLYYHSRPCIGSFNMLLALQINMRLFYFFNKHMKSKTFDFKFCS